MAMQNGQWGRTIAGICLTTTLPHLSGLYHLHLHGPPLLVAQPNFHSVGRHFIFVPLLYPTSPTHALFTPRFSMSHTNSSHMTSDSMPLARICMLVQLLVFIAPASNVADVLDLWPRSGEQEPTYQLHAMLILVRLFDT